MRWGLLALTAVTLAAACGGDDDGSDEVPTSTTSTTSTTVADSEGAFDTPADMAAALGCTDYEDGELGVVTAAPETREATGKCALDGVPVTLSTFASAEDLAAFEQQAEAIECQYAAAFGLSEVIYTVGDLWAAAGEPQQNDPGRAVDRAFAERLADELGGDVRTITC